MRALTGLSPCRNLFGDIAAQGPEACPLNPLRMLSLKQIIVN